MEARHEWWAVDLRAAAADGGFPRIGAGGAQAILDYIEELEQRVPDSDALLDAIAAQRVLTEGEVEEILSAENGPAIVLALRDWYAGASA